MSSNASSCFMQPDFSDFRAMSVTSGLSATFPFMDVRSGVKRGIKCKPALFTGLSTLSSNCGRAWTERDSTKRPDELDW